MRREITHFFKVQTEKNKKYYLLLVINADFKSYATKVYKTRETVLVSFIKLLKQTQGGLNLCTCTHTLLKKEHIISKCSEYFFFSCYHTNAEKNLLLGCYNLN